jgi:hypothetical protein
MENFQESIKTQLAKMTFLSWIGFSIFVFSIGYLIYSSWVRTLPQCYTIGVITEVKYGHKSPTVYYKYSIMNKDYEAFIPKSGRNYLKAGRRFYVTVPIGYYDEGLLLAEYPVPEYVEQPPSKGWTLKELQKIDPDFKKDYISD